MDAKTARRGKKPSADWSRVPAIRDWIERYTSGGGRLRAGVLLAAGLVVAAAFALGHGASAVEAAVMIGLPAWILIRMGRKRLAGIRAEQDAQDPAKGRRAALARLLLSATRSLPRFGGGFYGIIATATFLGYQVSELGTSDWLDLAAWHGMASRATTDPGGFLRHDIAGLLWDLVLPISETWIAGIIHASLWPLTVLKWGGWTGLVVLFCAASLASRFGPRLRRITAAWLVHASQQKRTDAASATEHGPAQPAERPASTSSPAGSEKAPATPSGSTPSGSTGKDGQ